MIRDFFPTFKQLEPGKLKGLSAGDVVAQLPVKWTKTESGDVYGVPTVTFNNVKYVENGIICEIGLDGKIVTWGTTAAALDVHTPMFIHFTEELNNVIDEKNAFAVKCAEDETYLRLVRLYPGDIFTTDNVAYTNGHLFAKVVDGIITSQATADVDTQFAIKKDTLPNGNVGYECIYLGLVKEYFTPVV